MNYSIQHYKSRRGCQTPVKHVTQHQEGMALVLALLMGMVLMTGVSGLLARQLMSRRLSAKESYQQMAEAAANNGLNRILGELNNAEPDKNRGFLFTLDNRENTNEPNNGFNWERLNTERSPQFSELCLDTSIGLPEHPSKNDEAQWPTTEVSLSEKNSPSMRDDGISKIETFYRLRGYSSPGTSGSTDSGEAKFIIEGIVRRQGADPESYLARSRLERSLYIQSWVDINRSSDWAILAATHYELGPIQLNSSGLVLWHTDASNGEQITGECNSRNLVQRLGANTKSTPGLQSRIWPVINQKQPPSSIFKRDGSKDHYPGQPSEIRVWRIDDTHINPVGRCSLRVACQRTSKSDFYNRPPQIDSRIKWRLVNNQWQATATIRLRQEDICQGSTGDCHIYVDRINLDRSKLLIENGSRPVVVHLLGPERGNSNTDPNQAASITLGQNASICGVNANSIICNQKPEKLIITTEATQSPDQCNSNDNRLNLSGNSLPAALVMLRGGTVSLSSNTQLRGLIWTHSFCSNGHELSLNAQGDHSGSESLLHKSSTLWNWSGKGFAGYGRKITRGIRGTGLDQFQRF
jgi:hypothetical protein